MGAWLDYKIYRVNGAIQYIRYQLFKASDFKKSNITMMKTLTLSTILACLLVTVSFLPINYFISHILSACRCIHKQLRIQLVRNSYNILVHGVFTVAFFSK